MKIDRYTELRGDSLVSSETGELCFYDDVEAQIEAMKCCGNCKHYTSEPCTTCKRGFICLGEDKLDNWEMKE